jgi:hypothetical protein
LRGHLKKGRSLLTYVIAAKGAVKLAKERIAKRLIKLAIIASVVELVRLSARRAQFI